LDHASSRTEGAQNILTQSDQQLSMEEVTHNHHRLAEQWEILVKRARGISGFEDFLRPKKFEQLCSAANTGPVVVLNVHEHHCDALVLMAGLDEVLHIPLEHLSYKKAWALHQSLNEVLSVAHVHARDTRAVRHVTTTTGLDFASILSYLWSCVVKPVMDGLALTVSYLLFYCLD